MKPRDAFGVIVRTAGLGFVLAGVIDLIGVAIAALGVPPTYPLTYLLAATAGWIVLGLTILVGASLIVRLVYGRDNSN